MQEPTSANPSARLTQEEVEDLQVVLQPTLPPDTRQAMVADFPIEQQPDWELVSEKIESGWIELHELRSRASGELLSSRLLVDYPSRFRGEEQFLLASFVVTPDTGKLQGSKQSKGKGYGSYLRQKSMELSRKRKPHALGIVAERESPAGAISTEDQRLKRARWMSRLGLFKVEGCSYEIPPFSAEKSKVDGYVPVKLRTGPSTPADLLIFRFDGKDTISGKILKSIVERLYLFGYGLSSEDEYYIHQVSQIDELRQYNLVGA